MAFSDWEMIDDGSFNGLKKFIRSSDEDEGTVQVMTQQNVNPFLDRNKRSQVDTMNTRMGDGLEKVAHIPTHIIYEWITKHGVNLYDPNHQDGVVRLLNSSDYRWLKCRDIYI